MKNHSIRYKKASFCVLFIIIFFGLFIFSERNGLAQETVFPPISIESTNSLANALSVINAILGFQDVLQKTKNINDLYEGSSYLYLSSFPDLQEHINEQNNLQKSDEYNIQGMGGVGIFINTNPILLYFLQVFVGVGYRWENNYLFGLQLSGQFNLPRGISLGTNTVYDQYVWDKVFEHQPWHLNYPKQYNRLQGDVIWINIHLLPYFTYNILGSMLSLTLGTGVSFGLALIYLDHGGQIEINHQIRQYFADQKYYQLPNSFHVDWVTTVRFNFYYLFIDYTLDYNIGGILAGGQDKNFALAMLNQVGFGFRYSNV